MIHPYSEILDSYKTRLKKENEEALHVLLQDDLHERSKKMNQKPKNSSEHFATIYILKGVKYHLYLSLPVYIH